MYDFLVILIDFLANFCYPYPFHEAEEAGRNETDPDPQHCFLYTYTHRGNIGYFSIFLLQG